MQATWNAAKVMIVGILLNVLFLHFECFGLDSRIDRDRMVLAGKLRVLCKNNGLPEFTTAVVLVAELGQFNWAEEMLFESIVSDKVRSNTADNTSAHIFEMEYRTGNVLRAIRFLQRANLEQHDLQYLVRYVAIHAIEDGRSRPLILADFKGIVNDENLSMLLQLIAIELECSNGGPKDISKIESLLEELKTMPVEDLDLWSAGCVLAFRCDGTKWLQLVSRLKADRTSFDSVCQRVVRTLIQKGQFENALMVLKEMPPGIERAEMCVLLLGNVLTSNYSELEGIGRQLASLEKIGESELSTLAIVCNSFGQFELGDRFGSRVKDRHALTDISIKKAECLILLGNRLEAQKCLENLESMSSRFLASNEIGDNEWSPVSQSLTSIEIARLYGKLHERENVGRHFLQALAAIEKAKEADGFSTGFGRDGVWLRFAEVALEIGETEQFTMAWSRIRQSLELPGRKRWGSTAERTHEILCRIAILAMKTQGIDSALGLVNANKGIPISVIGALARIYGRSSVEVDSILPARVGLTEGNLADFGITALYEWAHVTPGIIVNRVRDDLRLPSNHNAF